MYANNFVLKLNTFVVFTFRAFNCYVTEHAFAHLARKNLNERERERKRERERGRVRVKEKDEEREK